METERTRVPTGKGETVLVVEDDPGIRELAVVSLRALGYQPIAVADGAAALEVLRSGQAVDLLFTDMNLPGGMDGRETAETARTLRPALPVLFTSGYSDHMLSGKNPPGEGTWLLTKPWRRAELAARIRQALDGT